MNNPLGLRALLRREIHRFLTAPFQTIIQPAINTTLYLLMFGFATGGADRAVDGVPYTRFVAPGLIMLVLVQTSLLNTASSLLWSKQTGTINDLLVAPLSTLELLSGFMLGGVARGLTCGALVFAVSWALTRFPIAHPLFALAVVVLTATAFALVGVVVGIVANKMDRLLHLNGLVTFPLVFLGGVFYSVRTLPKPWSTVARLDPVLYMVEGLRYALLDTTAVSPLSGLAVSSGFALVGAIAAYRMLATGYNLRS